MEEIEKLIAKRDALSTEVRADLHMGDDHMVEVTRAELRRIMDEIAARQGE